MRRASLLSAFAIILAANAFALVHAWRNRLGPGEANITLTERELAVAYDSNEDNSRVSLLLSWLDPGVAWVGRERPAPWIDQKTLEAMGFDTSVTPSDVKAQEFYERQRPRRVFVAMEYDDAAWRKYAENGPPGLHNSETRGGHRRWSRP